MLRGLGLDRLGMWVLFRICAGAFVSREAMTGGGRGAGRLAGDAGITCQV